MVTRGAADVQGGGMSFVSAQANGAPQSDTDSPVVGLHNITLCYWVLYGATTSRCMSVWQHSPDIWSCCMRPLQMQGQT